MTYYIGLDLGGTNIKAGIVDEHAKVLAKLSVPTQGQGGPGVVIDVMASAVKEVAKQANLPLDQVAGIGIGAPGMLDMKRGIVLALTNLPGWKNISVRDEITKKTGRPAVLENDANAAGFGEFWAGAGRDPSIQNMVMLTLGTGVGSGIIINGKVLHGAHDLGGEAGHMIVVPNGRLCGCGQRGCIEAYASASHTANRTIEALEAGENSTLKKTFDIDRASITAKAVFDAAKAGDGLALRIVDETATYLGLACISLCRILDPQMIVFAGGMILAGPFLFDRIRAVFKQQSWKVVDSPVEIVPAQLGNDAGFIGAAAVAWDAFRPDRKG